MLNWSRLMQVEPVAKPRAVAIVADESAGPVTIDDLLRST